MTETGPDPAGTDASAPGDRYEQSNVGVTVNAVQHGNQYIYQYGSAASYEVVDFPGQSPLPRAQDRALSRLLVARYQVVPFTGRTGLQRDLAAWLTEDAALSVRLVHGPGGQGKTRLAARIAQQARDTGWAVASASHLGSAPRSGGPRTAVAGGPRGLLLIIDYAERWPSHILQAAITDHRAAGGVLRVLLLARPAGAWWAGLAHGLDRVGIEDVEVIDLDGLGAAPQDRAGLFADAARALAAHLPGSDPTAVPVPPDLDTDARYALALTVHMAALVGLDAHRENREAPPDADSLSAYLLQRERDHWQRLHTAGRITVTDRVIGHATYVAALTGNQPHQQAVQALVRVGIAADAATADTVLADHALAYPPANAQTWLEPLYPDRLAEDYLALTTPGCPAPAPTDPWATPAVSLLLAPDDDAAGEPPAYTRSLLGMLIEASARWPHLAEKTLHPLLSQQPHLAPHAGGAALTRLARLLDADHLKAIAEHLPQTQHLDLDPGVLAVTERLVAHLNDTNADDDTRALWARRLGNSYSFMGLPEEALAATEQAIEIYRRLAAARPDTYEGDLARALNGLGVDLSNLGRREEALAATEQAIEIYRRLAAARPDTYEGDLARALNNLGAWLSNLGRREEALAATEQAIEIYRRLAAARPDTYEGDLALALTNLGAGLSDLGRREEALAATEQAIEIYRRLAAARPDTYEGDLALALNGLGVDLSNLGRREEALAATEQAIEIYRRLAAARPDTYEGDLARALNNLGAWLSNLGRREEALAATEQAIEIYRRLAAARPDTYEGDLARALNNLGAWLSNLGRREEALAATEQAIEIYRRLAAARPDTYEGDLALALTNLGADLSNLGRREEAPAATEQAIEIYRRLAAARPDTYEGDLALALTNLGARLSDLGRREEALAATEQAIEIYRRLAAARPDTYEGDLALALTNLGARLSDLGRREEALAATEQAIEIYRRLAAARPDTYEGDLAMALNNLGADLSDLGRREEALAATEQAIEIYRRLAAARPDTYEGDLALALTNLGARLSNLGRREEALAATEQAIEIYRRLAAARPDAFEPDLARSLWAAGWVVGNAPQGHDRDSVERALTLAHEAVTLYESLASRRPAVFAGDLEAARGTHDQLRQALDSA